MFRVYFPSNPLLFQALEREFLSFLPLGVDTWRLSDHGRKGQKERGERERRREDMEEGHYVQKKKKQALKECESILYCSLKFYLSFLQVLFRHIQYSYLQV